MKILFLFCVSVLIFKSTVYGQYINTSYKDAQEIKSRILLVNLPDDDKNLLSKYEEENSAYSALYRNDIEGQRRALKKAVSEHWKFSDSIVIVSQKEAKALMKKAPDRYAVMKMGEQLQDMIYLSHNQSEPPQVAWEMRNEKLVYNSSKRYNVKMLGITSLVIELPKRVIEVYLPKMSPSEGDYIYAVTQMDYILSNLLKFEGNSASKLYRDINSSSGQLKNKMLLLDGSEIRCKEEDIKKVYPYPFKIVNYDTVEKAMKSKDTTSLVIQSSRYESSNSTYYLSNAGDGTIYCNYTGLTFNFGEIQGTFNGVKVYYPFISIKHFERYGSVK